MLRDWLEIIVQYEGLVVQLGGESVCIGSGSVLADRFDVRESNTAFSGDGSLALSLAIFNSGRFVSCH